MAGGARHPIWPERWFAWTGCRATATSSPTSRSGRPGIWGASNPHAARADLAGIDPLSRRGAGRNGVWRHVPGLQQQAIDGVELVYNNIPGGRFYEVLKHATETKHVMLINFEVVGSKWFDSATFGLPGRALIEECKRAGGETWEKILSLEAEVVSSSSKSRGMTIEEDVDLAAFRKAGGEAYEELNIAEAKKASARRDRQTLTDEAGRCRAVGASARPFQRRSVYRGRVPGPDGPAHFRGRLGADGGHPYELVHRSRDLPLCVGVLSLRRHRVAQRLA